MVGPGRPALLTRFSFDHTISLTNSQRYGMIVLVAVSSTIRHVLPMSKEAAATVGHAVQNQPIEGDTLMGSLSRVAGENDQ